MSNTILKTVAGVVALAAIAFGASAIAGASGSGSSSSSGFGPRAGVQGRPPGFGSPVSGATAAKVKAAALAKYPGTVEGIFALPSGGGYVAHVFQKNGGEVHVRVSSQFAVTGIDNGPPGGPPPGGRPPGGIGPPSGAGAAPPQHGQSS